MHNVFNFRCCRAVSVVPTVKEIEFPPRPPKPKRIVLPWGKVPIVPEGPDNLTVEQEMMKLHYIYRKMEASQHHYHEESELVLARQKSMLETLQFDNSMIQDKIDVFYPEDFAEEMMRLKEQCDIWFEKYEAEATRVREIGEATLILYDNAYSSQKLMGGVFATRDLSFANQVHTHILEKRIFKAMQDLTVIRWHNKLMKDEMNSLRIEHKLFTELHGKMEIELQECVNEMNNTINNAYELYDERHDYHKLISEIMEIMEESDSFTRWQEYGMWLGINGRPLVESALQEEAERTERLRNKRPTIALTNEDDLKKMFVMEGTEDRIKITTKPHTKKYERLIEIKAFMNVQELLGLKTEQEEEVLPALSAALQRHGELSKEVQALNLQVEEAIRSKMNRFAEMMGSWDLEETNDFLDIIRELKRQIFLVFSGTGNLDWDEYKASEDDSPEVSLEEEIANLFSKTGALVAKMSDPSAYAP